MPGGKRLEILILASQTCVRLTQVPQAARPMRDRSPGGRGARPKFVAVNGPCDFFGCYVASGRSLILDAKECGEPHRLVTDGDHLAEHQRLELIRHGEAGAVAGLLALRTTDQELFWVPWRLLCRRRPSIPWAEASRVGSAKLAVDWLAVERADGLADPRGWPE